MKKTTITEKFGSDGTLIERKVVTEETFEGQPAPLWLNPNLYSNPFVPYCVQPSSITTTVPPGALVTYTGGVAGNIS